MSIAIWVLIVVLVCLVVVLTCLIYLIQGIAEGISREWPMIRKFMKEKP